MILTDLHPWLHTSQGLSSLFSSVLKVWYALSDWIPQVAQLLLSSLNPSAWVPKMGPWHSFVCDKFCTSPDLYGLASVEFTVDIFQF